MNCSNCGYKSVVFNTAKTKTHVYRERMCDHCGHKWYTVESVGGDEIGGIIVAVKEARRLERSGRV